MKFHTAGLCAVLTMALAACGGGDDGSTTATASSTPVTIQCKLSSSKAPVLAQDSARVVYAGTELTVDGVTYQAADQATDACVKGELLVMAKAGRLAELTALVTAFQLRIDDTYNTLDGMAISVPLGYESQWLQALAAQDVVKSVNANGVVTTAQ